MNSFSADNYLNWFFIHQEYCTNASRKLNLEARCNEEYGKLYLFSDKRRTLTESQDYCKQQFNMPAASDLVIFGSCGEYMYVQNLLLDIANKRKELWDQENGSKTLETWTKSDRIPAGGRGPPILEKGRVYKRSVDKSYEEDFVEDETDVSACTTNNTFAASQDGVPASNTTAAEYSHRNLTTSFRPWDDGDETETRYPICQLKFDRIFWEAGKFNIKNPNHVSTAAPAAELATIPTIESVTTEMFTEPEGDDVLTTTDQWTTTDLISELETPDAPASHANTEAAAEETVTEAAKPNVLSTLKPIPLPSPATAGDETTTASAKISTSAPDPLATSDPREERKSHSPFYDDKHSQIQDLRERFHRPHTEPPVGLDLPHPNLDMMSEANKIAGDLVSHSKTSNDSNPGEVQEFILCMKHLHELVTDVLKPSMPHDEPESSGNNVRERVRQQAIEFSSLAVDGFSNLLDKPNPWQQLDQANRSMSAITMMTQVHHLSFTLGCLLPSGHHQISEENINMEVFGIESGIIPSNFSFPSTSDNMLRHNNIRFTTDVLVQKNSCGRHVASGIIYHNLAAHMKPADEDFIMNSHLVSFSLSNTTESLDLENGSKVQITFMHIQPLKFGDVSNCVFWDVQNRNWSGRSCEKVDSLSSRNQTVCECDHLTNFAVLMDISSREEDDEIKNLLTLICSSASIICLSLTIACILFVKSLRNRRSVITANLSACLLLTNLLVLFGFDQTEELLLCRIVSGLTLYSLLSAFMWMLMEGYLLYQMIILVFRSVGHLNMMTMYLLGYTPPAIVLLVFVAVTGGEGLYDPEFSYFCWISNRRRTSYIWSFAGPALAIVLVNAVILTRSFIAALSSQNGKKPSTQQQQTDRSASANSSATAAGVKGRLATIKRWLKGWTSLMILVGLTWVTGVMYIHEAASWLSYVFICLNGLQGLLIFLFEIVLNSKTRKSLIQIMRRKIPNASKYLPTLSKTSSNNLSNTSKTKSTNTTSTSPTGSQSNLSRNLSLDACCDSNFCAHVVTEPDGKDFTPHHLFHHHHAVPRLVMHEKFSTFSERL